MKFSRTPCYTHLCSCALTLVKFLNLAFYTRSSPRRNGKAGGDFTIGIVVPAMHQTVEGEVTGGQGENHSARVGWKCLVGGIRRLLRRGDHADRMGAGASGYLAGVSNISRLRFLS